MNMAAERPVAWYPGWDSRSSTTTEAPLRASRQATEAPAMPAPITAKSRTWFSIIDHFNFFR
jgi:hypothetical protein